MNISQEARNERNRQSKLHNETADKDHMLCPSCGDDLRYVPAGTSWLGKPYPEFWVCDNQVDDFGIPCEGRFNRDRLT